jgi:signal transduction histidine kinase
MIPLVIASSLLFAAAAPVAYGIVQQRVLVAAARADATRIARVIEEAAQQRPRLWRYDAAKLSERLAAEGLDRMAALVVHDERGVMVPVGATATATDAGHLLWGQARATIGERTVAAVWVGSNTGPLFARTAKLALLFLVLAMFFGAFLYLIPTRAIVDSEARVRALVGQLALTLPEDERRRIARELHDGVGQALTAARLNLLAAKRISTDSAAMEKIAGQIDEAIEEVRRATRALLPPALEELGLAGAIERHCNVFAAFTGIAIDCTLSNELAHADREIETACYRVAQEALTNVARHADATRAWVRLGATATRLELEIADNGVGLGAAAVQGSGIRSIRERVALLGGTMAFAERNGGGAQLRVAFPLHRGA